MSKDLKYVSVKREDEKGIKKYLVDATSMVDVEAILTEELQCEFEATAHATNHYHVITDNSVAENDDKIYVECKFFRENIESKIEKETHLFICDNRSHVLDYVSDMYNNDTLEFSSIKVLDVTDMLEASASKEDIEELVTKFEE